MTKPRLRCRADGSLEMATADGWVPYRASSQRRPLTDSAREGLRRPASDFFKSLVAAQYGVPFDRVDEMRALMADGLSDREAAALVKTSIADEPRAAA